MAYGLVVHALANGANTGTTSAIDSSGSSLLIIGRSRQTAPVVSDSKGNTWTPCTEQVFGGVGVRLYFVENPTVGASHTATNAVSGWTGAFCFAAFSGALTSGVLDQQNGATPAHGTSGQPGSITPSVDNCLIITAVTADDVTGTYAIDSGFTIIDQINLVGGTSFGVAVAYKIQTTAAAVNPTWSWASAADPSMVIASFKAAGGGGGSPFKNFYPAVNASSLYGDAP